jgi:putative Holliday junction resolvase
MNSKRMLGIDYGKKRIGLAITDPLNIFAYGLTGLNNNEKIFEQLKKIIDEYDVGRIVIGYPLRENGEFSHSTKDVLEFVDELKKRFDIEIELWDETYTSKIAAKKAIEIGMKKKDRRNKKEIDKLAAQTILSDYLESFQRNNSK